MGLNLLLNSASDSTANVTVYFDATDAANALLSAGKISYSVGGSTANIGRYNFTKAQLSTLKASTSVATGLNLDITGVTNGVKTYFACKVVRIDGTSVTATVSPASGFLISGTTPDAPVLDLPISISPTSATVRLNYPNFNGGLQITSFDMTLTQTTTNTIVYPSKFTIAGVDYTPSSGIITITAAQATAKLPIIVTFTSLDTMSRYEAVSQAINGMGFSPDSNTIIVMPVGTPVAGTISNINGADERINCTYTASAVNSVDYPILGLIVKVAANVNTLQPERYIPYSLQLTQGVVTSTEIGTTIFFSEAEALSKLPSQGVTLTAGFLSQISIVSENTITETFSIGMANIYGLGLYSASASGAGYAQPGPVRHLRVSQFFSIPSNGVTADVIQGSITAKRVNPRIIFDEPSENYPTFQVGGITEKAIIGSCSINTTKGALFYAQQAYVSSIGFTNSFTLSGINSIYSQIALEWSNFLSWYGTSTFNPASNYNTAVNTATTGYNAINTATLSLPMKNALLAYSKFVDLSNAQAAAYNGAQKFTVTDTGADFIGFVIAAGNSSASGSPPAPYWYPGTEVTLTVNAVITLSTGISIIGLPSSITFLVPDFGSNSAGNASNPIAINNLVGTATDSNGLISLGSQNSAVVVGMNPWGAAITSALGWTDIKLQIDIAQMVNSVAQNSVGKEYILPVDNLGIPYNIDNLDLSSLGFNLANGNTYRINVSTNATNSSGDGYSGALSTVSITPLAKPAQLLNPVFRVSPTATNYFGIYADVPILNPITGAITGVQMFIFDTSTGATAPPANNTQSVLSQYVITNSAVAGLIVFNAPALNAWVGSPNSDPLLNGKIPFLTGSVINANAANTIASFPTATQQITITPGKSYTILARNMVSNTSFSDFTIYNQVLSYILPTAPNLSSLSAVKGLGSIRAVWTLPSNNGYGLNNGLNLVYNLTVYSGTEKVKEFSGIPNLTYTIPAADLIPGTSYNVTVAATNTLNNRVGPSSTQALTPNATANLPVSDVSVDKLTKSFDVNYSSNGSFITTLFVAFSLIDSATSVSRDIIALLTLANGGITQTSSITVTAAALTAASAASAGSVIWNPASIGNTESITSGIVSYVDSSSNSGFQLF